MGRRQFVTVELLAIGGFAAMETRTIPRGHALLDVIRLVARHIGLAIDRIGLAELHMRRDLLAVDEAGDALGAFLMAGIDRTVRTVAGGKQRQGREQCQV